MEKKTAKIIIVGRNNKEIIDTAVLLQNISDTVDFDTKKFLADQVKKDPKYFQKIAKKLQNPVIQRLL